MPDTTLSALIQRTKLHLLGNTREELNKLAADYTAGAASLTFTYPPQSIAAGADLEIGAEVLRVMSISGQTVQVMGAQLGTVAANHTTGDTIIVNPRFYAHSIISDLNNAMNDMSGAGLYRENAIDVTFNPVVSGYDLTGSDPTTVLDILEIRYRETGPTKRYPVIRGWSLLRNMDATVFASGTAFIIDQGGFPGLPLRVRYSSSFTDLVNLTDGLVAVAGVAPTANDLPPIGAAIRQMMGRDVKRSFLESQPDTRRSAEVPPGVAQGAITTLRRMWDEGVSGERMRQLQRYPYRMTR